MQLNRRPAVILALLAAGFALGAQRKPSTKPRVEIVELTAARELDGTISIVGRVRNSGGQPIERLTLGFKLLASRNEVVSSLQGALDDSLDLEQEAEFHWQTRDHPRAVRLTVEAQDHTEKVIEVVKPGPYVIQ